MDATNADDLPFDLPEPRALSDRLMDRSWADAVHDVDRELLEAAALTINGLLARLAAAAEHDEARRSRR
jgi:hypothetical protein